MNDDKALCHRSRMKGETSLWDTRLPKESTQEMIARNLRAKLICHQCPLLEPCEKYLSACEQQDLPITGVIAGRYSDVRTRHMANDLMTLQRTCRACSAELIPQSGKTHYVSPQARAHKGEGLCEQCFPIFSRTARAVA